MRGRGGFSLIEAVVAVGILALGCLAAAGVLQVSLHAEAAGRQRREAARLLDAEAARLRALPFFRLAIFPGGGPPSLLADVFPHARLELNEPPDGFADDSGAAVFSSEVQVDGVRLRRTATLVRDVSGDLTPVPAADARGWAVWEDKRPPALALDLRLELAGGPRGVTERHLVLRALPPASAVAFGAAAASARAAGGVVTQRLRARPGSRGSVA